MSEHPADNLHPSDHFLDHHPVRTGGIPTYGNVLAGQGRWCVLEAPLGRPVGTLWTDDADALGFIPVDAQDNPAAPAFAADVRAAVGFAKGIGSPATVVFDAWSDRGSQALAARPVESGDLATLAERLL